MNAMPAMFTAAIAKEIKEQGGLAENNKDAWRRARALYKKLKLEHLKFLWDREADKEKAAPVGYVAFRIRYGFEAKSCATAVLYNADKSKAYACAGLPEVVEFDVQRAKKENKVATVTTVAEVYMTLDPSTNKLDLSFKMPGSEWTTEMANTALLEQLVISVKKLEEMKSFQDAKEIRDAERTKRQAQEKAANESRAARATEDAAKSGQKDAGDAGTGAGGDAIPASDDSKAGGDGGQDEGDDFVEAD